MEPFASELLEQARGAHDPNPEDQARVRAKLALRLAAGALATSAVGASGKAAGSVSWIVKTLLPFVLLSGAGGYAMLQETPDLRAAAPLGLTAPAPDLVADAPPAPQPAEAPVVVDTAPVPPSAAAASASVPGHTPRPGASASADLEGEMSLLASAQAAIQRGDYATALAKLDEHQRSFPRGVLGEERTAASVVALCGAGRRAEARALGASFLARHPGSPLAPRVKSSCAGQ